MARRLAALVVWGGGGAEIGKDLVTLLAQS